LVVIQSKTFLKEFEKNSWQKFWSSVRLDYPNKDKDD
jgi:hypothetical protein